VPLPGFRPRNCTWRAFEARTQGKPDFCCDFCLIYPGSDWTSGCSGAVISGPRRQHCPGLLLGQSRPRLPPVGAKAALVTGELNAETSQTRPPTRQTAKRRLQKVRLPTPPPPTFELLREGTKLAKLVALLSRPTGASMGEMVRLTEWRENPIRGAMAGIMKGRIGLRAVSIKSYDRIRRYYATNRRAPQLPNGVK
jgi:hypothetical protein